MIDELQLGDLMLAKGQSLNPLKHEEQTFELYSIPAYDKGKPEIIQGKNIGSTKKILENGDVILSRIVPHIRRCQVIESESNNQKLGSGEWIVFRSKKIDPNYLRHYLQSDLFHAKFMLTVKGVGGSLLRADPKQVGNFKLFIPPLETQKHIAEILDAADNYRQKTKALIEKYDELAQSLFLDMFGDPVANPKGWEVKKFEEFADFDMKMTTDFEKYSELPHIGIANIEKNTGKLINYKTVKEEKLSSGKYYFNSAHIIYSKIRPKLNKVAMPEIEGLCSADSYPILPKKEISNRVFLVFLLRSKSFLDHILQHSSRTNIPKANKKQIDLYTGICPPFKLQNEFAAHIEKVELQKSMVEKGLRKAEELFQNLLQKAFKGELV